MQESNTVMAATYKEPLALVPDVLQVAGHHGTVLMGSQALLVQKSKASTTLVSATTVAVPDPVPINRIQL